eukprot:CCRYP_013041-RA/>CCRYP_013041-RA protein AED:0.40 eAED:0.40 QI:0/0/0/1/0/0/3/0/294
MYNAHTNSLLIYTAANITLLANGAPSDLAKIQSHPKAILEPKGSRMLTTDNLLLLVEGPRDKTLAHLPYPWRWKQHCSPRPSLAQPHPQVNNIYKCENTSQLINFYYATMGYPVISTCIKAIDKGYFQGWRGLTSDRTRRFIKPSELSELGHMDQRRAGIRYTKSSYASPPSPVTMEVHEQAPGRDKSHMVFMTLTKVDGQLFTDQTGSFPVTSNCDNTYIVIFYAVDANYIKFYPIKSCHHTKLLKAYAEVYQYLRIRRYWSQLHKLDKTSRDVQEFIAENNTKHQYTPQDIH